MSEQYLNKPSEPTPVFYTGNIEGMIAFFQSSIQSKGSTEKILVNTNNICTSIVKEVTYFPYTSKDINEAILVYRRDFKEINDHKGLLSKFSDFHDYLERVEVRTLYMNNGNIIRQVISPCIQTTPLTDDNSFFVLTPAHANWWLKNAGLCAIIESIQEDLPDFKPWLGERDTFVAIIKKVANKVSGLVPTKQTSLAV